ncbi:hypothetical protein LPJ56_004794 [Coemansia sp. RSA 2599]|nr:hypothetical protein LPJ56_004794 [Coemansia sp. RSA 2599]
MSSSSDFESSQSTLLFNDNISAMPSTPIENGHEHEHDHNHDHAAVLSADEGSFPANVPLLRSCENCRRKKRKCSSHKPVCTRCKAQGETCYYRPTARYFKPLRNNLEKAAAAAASPSAAATHGRKRASLASTALKSRSKDISGGRPRALSAVSALKKMHVPEGITSLSPAELMLSTASAFTSQPISPMSPSYHHPYANLTNQQQQQHHHHQKQHNQKQQQGMSQKDLIYGVSSVPMSAPASASADGLSYMGGLAISGAGCLEESSSGILTPQTSLPQLPISSASTPQMMLNGQEFAFGSVSPTMVISPSSSSPLASSPTSISASAAAAVAAAQQQQQQQQYLYPQTIAASAAMAAMAAMSGQSPAIYPPESDYSQMVLASALSRQQQQQQQQHSQAAAALMGASHLLNSPPLSTSSFSTAGMTEGTPSLGECLPSSYPMCIPTATPQQQVLQFSAWPAAVSTTAVAEPMDAASVSSQMASMLAPSLMAGIPGSPGGHGNVGLDFILPQAKPSFAEWLV